MRIVSRRTGLSPHVIRAWERRYGAVKPARSGTNRRMYSAGDIRRLQLLASAVAAGYTIGQIASLTDEDLRRLAEEARGSGLRQGSVFPGSAVTAEAESHLDRCMEAVRQLDERMLESELGRAAAILGQTSLLMNVVAPLLVRVGECWRTGELRASHEHMASAVIRTMLGSLTEGFDRGEAAARMVITTPVGHLHEFGALLAAHAATADGWRVTYLGPNLPAPEIAGAVMDSGAKAVALSLTYPPNDARVSADLKELRRLLGDTPIIAGGRAAEAYADVLDQIGAVRVDDLAAFRSALDDLR